MQINRDEKSDFYHGEYKSSWNNLTHKNEGEHIKNYCKKNYSNAIFYEWGCDRVKDSCLCVGGCEKNNNCSSCDENDEPSSDILNAGLQSGYDYTTMMWSRNNLGWYWAWYNVGP